MAYDGTILKIAHAKRVNILASKLIDDNDTFAGKKFSLGACCKMRFISEAALRVLNEDATILNKLSRLDNTHAKYALLSGEKVLSTKTRLSEQLINEHIIPTSVLVKWFSDLPTDQKTTAVIKQLLDDSCDILSTCLVTKSEDKLLNAAKLKSKMPKGWCGTLDNMDMFARYNVVGIKVCRF